MRWTDPARMGECDGMTCDLVALCFDAKDPIRIAGFWSGVLGWEASDDQHRHRSASGGEACGAGRSRGQ